MPAFILACVAYLSAAGPRVLPPALLALGLAMGGLYALIRRG